LSTSGSSGKSHRQQTSSESRAIPAASLDELQRDILSIGREYQSLSAQVERLRADFERARVEENHKTLTLEQIHQADAAAWRGDAERLAALQQRFTEAEAAREQTREQIRTIETSLEEASERLEKRNNQLRFLQNSTSEQIKALETSLAEASSRLETRDNQLGDRRTRRANRPGRRILLAKRRVIC
jgi:chromosome segregation ATPase